MKTLEVSYIDMVKNTPMTVELARGTTTLFNEVRKSVRSLNRLPRRTVHVVLTHRPGNVITDDDGRKFLITRKGRYLAI